MFPAVPGVHSALVWVRAHQHGGQGGCLGEVEVLAGQPPPGEAGAALQGLALRKLRKACPLLPVIVRLQGLGLWQAWTYSQQRQLVRSRSCSATASYDAPCLGMQRHCVSGACAESVMLPRQLVLFQQLGKGQKCQEKEALALCSCARGGAHSVEASCCWRIRGCYSDGLLPAESVAEAHQRANPWTPWAAVSLRCKVCKASAVTQRTCSLVHT